MANTFSLRGNQFAARNSSAGSSPGKWATVIGNLPTIVTPGSPPTGLIGPSYIDMFQGTIANRGLIYPGGNNFSQNAACSIHIRAALKDNSSLQGLWQIGGPWTALTPYQMYLFFVSNQWRVALYDRVGGNILNNFTIATQAVTAGQFYDLCIASTGTTAANGFKFYIDSVLAGQTTLSGGLTQTRDNGLITHIGLGSVASDVQACSMWANEFNIWDTAIDFTQNVTLESGPGLLNGQSRTSFVSVAAFDATVNTGAGATNIRNGTTETIAGNIITGTAVIPSRNDVRLSMPVDGTTGLLDLPATTDVKLSVQYDRTTKTGSYVAACDYPTNGNVRNGTVFASGVQTGTLVVPAASKVLEGTPFDTASVGSLSQLVEAVSVAVESDEILIKVE